MFKIANREIGQGKPAFIVAEIGINHNRSLVLAKETIDAAVRVGCDAVKFQNYRVEDFVPDKEITYTYLSQGKEVTETQWEMFSRYQIDREFLWHVSEHCKDRGIIFHSTPTSVEGINELVELGVPVLKNGSDFLQRLDIIEVMAKTGLPTIISVDNMLIDNDVLRNAYIALRTYRHAGGQGLIFLHCIRKYPCPEKEANIKAVETFKDLFSPAAEVGYSDHTIGVNAAIEAVKFGAVWIEKHFTLNRNLPGPDHHFSANPEEMTALVRGIREHEKERGIV